VVTRTPADGLEGAAATEGAPAADAEAEIRMIEEVVSVLALEISRLWDLVSEPADAGWAVLDVFVLGGPAFRGGVLGAARELGPEKIRDHLEYLTRRWGPLYTPDSLEESGLLGKAGGS
jgi:hypothetical protein